MLYGIGGGIIIVPAVYLFLRNLGFDVNISIQISIGTSMLNVFGSTISASHRHFKAGNIIWDTIKKLTPGLIVGSLIGIVLSHYFSGEILRKVFMVFLMYILIYSLFNRNFKRPWKMADYTPPSITSASLLGIFAGALSVLVGVGGGTIILPYLRHYRMPMLQGTAATATLAPILALIGSIGYFAMDLPSAPPYSIGAINMPIFICIFIGSWFGVQYGSLISLRFSETLRARTFPILIALILALMLI